MHINRREFVALSASSAFVLMMPRTTIAAEDATFFEWKPVAGPISVAFGQGGNSTLIDGKEMAYLFDTKNAPFGATIRREAKYKAAKLTVINTHHHPDHTGGNHAFVGDTPVLAHQKALPRIPGNLARYISAVKEAPASVKGKSGPAFESAKKDWEALQARWEKLTAKDFMPTQAVGDSRTLEAPGSVKLELHQFGPGHTDNDLVTHIPEHNVVIAADLLFRKLHPYVDADGGGNTQGWINALKETIKLCDAKTRVIPGHGELTDVSGLREQVDYFEKVREAVAKALKEGKERKEIVTMKIPFPGYANEERQGMALAAVYAEMK